MIETKNRKKKNKKKTNKKNKKKKKKQKEEWSQDEKAGVCVCVHLGVSKGAFMGTPVALPMPRVPLRWKPQRCGTS